MAKPNNKFQEMARQAAERLDAAAEQGRQLSLLPDEAGATPVQAGGGNLGRPIGAKNKTNSQMREWLAAQGFRMPEDVLARMAGLDTGDDPVLTAMQKAERAMTWAYSAAAGTKRDPSHPTGQQRLETFLRVYAIQMRAAEAVLPYGAPKATPDVHVNQQTTVIMPAPTSPGVTIEGRSTDGMRPPPLPKEIQQNQALGKSENHRADVKGRTE